MRDGCTAGPVPDASGEKEGMTQKPRPPPARLLKERCGEAQDGSRSGRSRSDWDGMEAAEMKGWERGWRDGRVGPAGGWSDGEARRASGLASALTGLLLCQERILLFPGAQAALGGDGAARLLFGQAGEAGDAHVIHGRVGAQAALLTRLLLGGTCSWGRRRRRRHPACASLARQAPRWLAGSAQAPAPEMTAGEAGLAGREGSRASVWGGSGGVREGRPLKAAGRSLGRGIRWPTRWDGCSARCAPWARSKLRGVASEGKRGWRRWQIISTIMKRLIPVVPASRYSDCSISYLVERIGRVETPEMSTYR